jgi:enolase-phosphatase E1
MTKAILTDIEGTTSSLAFVKEVLFPYATKKLPAWLNDNASDPAVRREIAAVAGEIERPASDIDAVSQQLLEWINQDVKATPLKALQGMLWKSGYESGDYRAHVYEDAVQKLQDWHTAGIPLYVYSSGSVQAQELFFQYSRYGDLRTLFAGYFDTTTGPKNEVDSYRTIAASIRLPTSDILFLSDAQAEVEAALAAGLEAVVIDRAEDSSIDPDDVSYKVARNFHEIRVSLPTSN